MKEKIYTIPVTEAFKEDCECTLCTLEKRLEDEYVESTLGPSLMEPDSRIDSNKKGFCRRHFESLYNKQTARLGLGLIIETHLNEQNTKFQKLFSNNYESIKKDSSLKLVKNITNKITAKKTDTENFVYEMISELKALESKCTICDKLDNTMERYIDVIIYLWFNETDFKNLFNSKKGFCLKHLRLLLEGVNKFLGPKDAAIFTSNLLTLQFENLDRIQQDVIWFNQKFDYRNIDAPWKNSKDALIRSIQKIVGFCNLK